jgi:MoxR-like ATPase
MIVDEFIQGGHTNHPAPGESLYIAPITTIHSTFTEAKESYDQHRGLPPLDDKEQLNVATLVLGKRNLIVGEPGVGKSLLLSRLGKHLTT